jgi:hypothetical protein
MGAKALAKYLQTTKVATRRWKLGIDNKPANATKAIGWGTHQQKIEKFLLCFGKTRFFSVASVASLASVASVASLSFPNNTTFFRCFPKLP